jgi:cell division septation protein DedD
MRRAILIALAVISLSAAAPAKAEQFAVGDHVVHTRRAPVVAHKVVPPFKGVHVYQGKAPRR